MLLLATYNNYQMEKPLSSQSCEFRRWVAGDAREARVSRCAAAEIGKGIDIKAFVRGHVLGGVGVVVIVFET